MKLIIFCKACNFILQSLCIFLTLFISVDYWLTKLSKQAEKDSSPSSRPRSTLTWSREIKALARLQVKPERLQEDGSRPCPQSVATSALGGASGASGGCDHREGSEVRGVVLGVWRVRAPVGSSSRCCRPRPVRPPTSFPQGSRWSRWGERALSQGPAGPSQGDGAPARPQGQQLHPQR